MRIGELAETIGVTTRTIRHYHRVGLLPEPPRRANGYRVYDLRDVLRLARARRLTELGLSLEEAADVLADDEGRELGEILADLDADLARQEADIRARRERLAALLRRDGPLDADDAVSAPTAELLDRIGAAFPDSDAARRDREYIALFDRDGIAAHIAEQYRPVLDDPAETARTAELYRRFDELVDAAPDDPRIAELAADWARSAPAGTTPPDDTGATSLGEAILDDLPPAQGAVIREAIRLWSEP